MLRSFAMDVVRRTIESDPRVAYAILFGSAARGTGHAASDVDVALGAAEGRPLTALDLGDIASRLEAALGRAVDVVDVDQAPPALAYRVFRDGLVLVARDRPRLAARRARAILEYLDFQPIEDLCTQGVLAAAGRGR